MVKRGEGVGGGGGGEGGGGGGGGGGVERRGHNWVDALDHQTIAKASFVAIPGGARQCCRLYFNLFPIGRSSTKGFQIDGLLEATIVIDTQVSN